jgi:hypothetical protein
MTKIQMTKTVKRCVSVFQNLLQFCCFKFDELVKSQKPLFFVIPAKAGIQSFQAFLDSRLRGSDGVEDFLRDHQT